MGAEDRQGDVEMENPWLFQHPLMMMEVWKQYNNNMASSLKLKKTYHQVDDSITDTLTPINTKL